MGLIHVEVGVSNPATPDVREKIRVLVDTGAMLSVLPTSMLERLGIPRVGSKRFRGFGGEVKRDIGNVTMHYDGEAGAAGVIFGNEDDPPIMGVTAMETMGFEADPGSGKLKHVEMLML